MTFSPRWSSARAPQGAVWSLLAQCPRQLLILTTGNITNDALLALFALHIDAILASLDQANLVELSQDALVLGRRSEDADV